MYSQRGSNLLLDSLCLKLVQKYYTLQHNFKVILTNDCFCQLATYTLAQYWLLSVKGGQVTKPIKFVKITFKLLAI